MADHANRARGRWGERRAVDHLRRLGFDILDRNWRPPERDLAGELDIVAYRAGVVVFCEVKARRRAGHGGAVGAVGADKQVRIRRLAASWLRAHAGAIDDDVDVRFDVIAIDGVTLRHWDGAF